MNNSDVFIISAVRTAIGSGKETGALHSIYPVELTALVMREAVRRAGVDADCLDDAVWGVVTPLGDQGANLARLGVLMAGFPTRLPAVSLNRMCGSSQQAVHFAAQSILAGDAELILAGGTEMMSHQPLGADYPSEWPDVGHPLIHQGLSAELVTEKWDLTRDQLDDYACTSHIKAGHAMEAGFLNDQILPVSLPDRDVFASDQGVRRPPDRERMRSLKPVFKADGKVTAGNSSQVSDGAAALLIASAAAVGRYNLFPLARIVARVAVGSDPTLMLDGVIPATRMVLKRAGLSLADMDVIEVNEAFACVPLIWETEFHPDMTKVNPNGGAIAHGHPLGATGAILMIKLVHELQRTKGRYGLQTMCIGHGMATATVLERV